MIFILAEEIFIFSVDLTGVISSSIIPTFSKISIFALLSGFSFFSNAANS
jgi:hypothetical protein|tara:strand:- start:335 stop:484 length:150 start_codon:yes stop_codon:yes gene_type:complete